MSGLFKLVEGLVLVVALVAGGLALWNHRDRVKGTWVSIGGTEGVVGTANRLMESAGPVRDLVNQFSRLK